MNSILLALLGLILTSSSYGAEQSPAPYCKAQALLASIGNGTMPLERVLNSPSPTAGELLSLPQGITIKLPSRPETYGPGGNINKFPAWFDIPYGGFENSFCAREVWVYLTHSSVLKQRWSEAQDTGEGRAQAAILLEADEALQRIDRAADQVVAAAQPVYDAADELGIATYIPREGPVLDSRLNQVRMVGFKIKFLNYGTPDAILAFRDGSPQVQWELLTTLIAKTGDMHAYPEGEPIPGRTIAAFFEKINVLASTLKQLDDSHGMGYGAIVPVDPKHIRNFRLASIANADTGSSEINTDDPAKINWAPWKNASLNNGDAMSTANLTKRNEVANHFENIWSFFLELDMFIVDRYGNLDHFKRQATRAPQPGRQGGEVGQRSAAHLENARFASAAVGGAAFDGAGAAQALREPRSPASPAGTPAGAPASFRGSPGPGQSALPSPGEAAVAAGGGATRGWSQTAAVPSPGESSKKPAEPPPSRLQQTRQELLASGEALVASSGESWSKANLTSLSGVWNGVKGLGQNVAASVCDAVAGNKKTWESGVKTSAVLTAAAATGVTALGFTAAGSGALSAMGLSTGFGATGAVPVLMQAAGNASAVYAVNGRVAGIVGVTQPLVEEQSLDGKKLALAAASFAPIGEKAGAMATGATKRVLGTTAGKKVIDASTGLVLDVTGAGDSAISAGSDLVGSAGYYLGFAGYDYLAGSNKSLPALTTSFAESSRLTAAGARRARPDRSMSSNPSASSRSSRPRIGPAPQD